MEFFQHFYEIYVKFCIGNVILVEIGKTLFFPMYSLWENGHIPMGKILGSYDIPKKKKLGERSCLWIHLILQVSLKSNKISTNHSLVSRIIFYRLP
jgi:hypothetical protein